MRPRGEKLKPASLRPVARAGEELVEHRRMQAEELRRASAGREAQLHGAEQNAYASAAAGQSEMDPPTLGPEAVFDVEAVAAVTAPRAAGRQRRRTSGDRL